MKNFFESFGAFFLENSSEENSFINSIFDNPFDITGMLAYTDWLDEHDDKLGDIIRSAIESSNPENYKNKGEQEPFYNLIKNKYQNNFERFGLLNINFKSGSFSYRDPDDQMIWVVMVNPTGQIMAKSSNGTPPGTSFHPVSIEKIKPLIAKRSALVLLIEKMVNSHRIKNPHGHHSPYRPKNNPQDRVETNWADHATYSVEMEMNYFIEQGTASSTDQEMVEMFEELVNWYMIPLEKMTRNLQKQQYKNSDQFRQLSKDCIRVANERNVCMNNKELCNSFIKLSREILSRIQD